jgi:hypothetical protein
VNIPLSKPIYIFSHIPKTGGLTMRRIIDENVPEDLIFRYPRHSQWYGQWKRGKKIRPAEVKNYRWVYGHCRFGVHRVFRRPFKYITMIREPLSRIISTYYFILSRPTNKLHKKVKNMSLEQFLNSDDPRILAPLSNHQTRFISGRNRPDLELAKKNIRDHYLLVGLTERYAESVFLLQKLFGWEHKHYEKENVNKKKPKKVEIPPALLEKIKKQNSLDYQLYEYCQDLFQQRINELSPSEKTQLRKYVARQD